MPEQHGQPDHLVQFLQVLSRHTPIENSGILPKAKKSAVRITRTYKGRIETLLNYGRLQGIQWEWQSLDTTVADK
jgi:hypothetical protein